MLKRILVAVVLAPLFFVVLFFLDSVWLAALMAAICALASFELLRATQVAHHNGMYCFTALSAAVIPIGVWLGYGYMVTQAAALVLMAVIFWISIRLYDHERPVRFEDALLCLFGGVMIPARGVGVMVTFIAAPPAAPPWPSCRGRRGPGPPAG